MVTRSRWSTRNKRRTAEEARAHNGHDQHHWSGLCRQGHRRGEERRRQAGDAENSDSTIGYFAYLEDTEGNLFGVMQSDANAK